MIEDERILQCRIEIAAPIEAVWEAWTTEAGARSFFAVDARIQAEPGGAYELFFDPSAPAGQQGSEGMRILSLQPPDFLSFSWNAPPHLKTVRDQQTHVILRMKSLPDGRTRVTLRQDGWGDGGEWDAAFAYFERAWGKLVLPRLKHYLETEAIDWSNPPAL